MADDIIEIKPGLGPITLNVRALLRRLGEKRGKDPVTEVAARFLQLFRDHGIAIPQIPRLISEVKLESLRSTDTLLPALTTDVLEKAATLFGVRYEWLEGVDDRIYERSFCYKQPEIFFEHLASITAPENGFTVHALTSANMLNGRDSSRQSLALVLVERIQNLGENEITRYHVYGDEWDWAHTSCRIQLKAIARVVFQIHLRPTPIHRVQQSDLQAILEGKTVPHEAVQGCLLTRPSLEDFALSSQESIQAKETEELPKVLDYINSNNLERLAFG